MLRRSIREIAYLPFSTEMYTKKLTKFAELCFGAKRGVGVIVLVRPRVADQRGVGPGSYKAILRQVQIFIHYHRLARLPVQNQFTHIVRP